MDVLKLRYEPKDTQKAHWQVISEAILQFGNFFSLDDLLHDALDAWLQRVSPELRWNVAVDLYSKEEVSIARAAEIAGLNYFVFEQKLRENRIPLVVAHSTTKAQKDKQKALIHEVFNIPS